MSPVELPPAASEVPWPGLPVNFAGVPSSGVDVPDPGALRPLPDPSPAGTAQVGHLGASKSASQNPRAKDTINASSHQRQRRSLLGSEASPSMPVIGLDLVATPVPH